MHAVIKTGGKQYLVKPGDKIKKEKIDKAEEGQEIVFDQVLLLINNKEKAKIGEPFLKNTKVKAKVLEQGRAKKVIIFKYKAKKRYAKKRGHRQPFTEIEITKIVKTTKKKKHSK